MKNRLLLSVTIAILIHLSAYSQFPYYETFKNATAPNLVVSGAARLTAASGIDAPGDGYLRLTDNVTNSVGYMYGKNAFPSNYGFSISFEFFSYKSGATSINQADGITFFLFDAAVNSFRPGGIGGSLGYAQYYNTPGMAKGYIGVSIDEYGNYSNATDGNKNGGIGQQRGSIAIRGPGNGRSATDYVYQTGVVAGDATHNSGFWGFTQRFPDSLQANYRRLKVIMMPGSSLGAHLGYTITVIMYKGGTPLTPVTLISNFDYPFAAPDKLQFGLTASTGSITNYHEIRNMIIDAANTSALLAPTTSNDNGIIACQGQQALLDVTANDQSNNTGGTINKATIDLDPSTAGIQTAYTDPAKGTYAVDANGLVSFMPVSGFSGISTASYVVDDSYGITATTPAAITITVNNATGPALTVSDPLATCAPALVNITSPTFKTVTTAGATYDYFNTVTDANNNANNIDATAASISSSGTYYIRASLNGCATIKPILVQISQPPSTAYAGTDGTFCSSTGSQSTTLLGSNPDVGTGIWTQVSGPAPATITYPNAATSPLSGMAKGIYIFRWSVSNGGCAVSTDDVQMTVGIPAVAGTAQSLTNVTTATLAGNAPAPGIGVWSQVSGPSITITDPSNPATTITGLVPGNAYTLSWKITNGTCSNTSQVTITNALNTIANAGIDQVIPNLTTFSILGNIPDVGNTGLWTIISAPPGSTATLTTPSSPATTVTSVNQYGDYVFRWTVTNGSFSNYDDVTIHIGTVLPLTWLSFTGQWEGSSVSLTWQTAAEEGNDHFDIERSADGLQFSIIKSLPATATAAPHNYSYQDPVKEEPNTVWYYRIKQIDLDGKSSYSPVIKLAKNAGSFFRTSPNPVTNRMQVRAFFDSPGKAQVKLYDNTGRVMKQLPWQVIKGDNTLEIEQLQGLSKGVFYIEVLMGSTRYQQTVLKN